MVLYKVTISHRADQDLEEIYTSSLDRWNFSETHTYVMGITEKIFSLDQMPQRIGFDFHTRSELTFRSFEHKAHKVFFTIDEDSETVNIVAVLPSRTKYSAKL